MDVWNIVLKNGVAVILVAIGIIEAIKVLLIEKGELSVKEWKIFFYSVLVGLLIGFSYQFAVVGIPDNAADWFGLIMFGLGFGAVMPWIYRAGGNIMEKVGKGIVKNVALSVGLEANEFGSEISSDEGFVEAQQNGTNTTRVEQ